MSNLTPKSSDSPESRKPISSTNSTNNKWANLSTITDFDFGIGDIEKSPIVRISELAPNVYHSSEVNLIIWLLLERESINWDIPESGGGGQGDSVDSVSRNQSQCVTPTGTSGSFPVQWGAGLSKAALTRRKACSYAESLLRAVGVNVPFELLEATKRSELFQLFSSSSNLLRGERYSSILDLYEALRRRSKFREEFEVLSTLGFGAFGQVYSVKDLKDAGSLSAIKRVPISSLESLDSILLILNESSVLSHLRGHPNIVEFLDSWLEYDSSQDNLVFYLQMELCGVSLGEWKEKYQKLLGSEILWKITNQMISALEWIHGKGFMHLDINPKNILWSTSTSDPNSSVILTDFGLAFQGTSFHGRVGTVPYCAPENTLTPKSDIYSLGVTLFEISQNFSTRSELILRLDKREIEPSALKTGIWFLDQSIPSMLKRQPSHRISLEDLKLSLAAMCNREENKNI